jgi:hypothetical protein
MVMRKDENNKLAIDTEITNTTNYNKKSLIFK